MIYPESRQQRSFALSKDLIHDMSALLSVALDAEGVKHGTNTRDLVNLPLIGSSAILSSLGLVSYIADIEVMLSEKHNIFVTLVSEQALSRARSPFRNVERLAEYVYELAGSQAAADS